MRLIPAKYYVPFLLINRFENHQTRFFLTTQNPGANIQGLAMAILIPGKGCQDLFISFAIFF
jgi:hypothetical protein